MLLTSNQNAGERLPASTASLIAAASRRTSPSGYATEIRVGQQGQAGEMDVRRDQEHPREETDTNRQDQRVDERGSIGPRVPSLDEDEQPRHQGGIDEQIERVPDRREPHVRAEQLGIAVRVEVAAEEEELSCREEPPRRTSARLVHPDSDDDGDDTGEAEGIDQRPVSGQRRSEEVQGGENARTGQVPEPDLVARDLG